MSLATVSSLICNAFAVFGLLILANILYKLFVLPLWTLRFYKSQGIATYFFPMMGFARRDRKFQAKTNDYFGYYKTLPQNDPNVRAIAGNVGAKVHLHIMDPQLAKEVYNHPTYYKKNLAFKLIPAMMGTGLFLAEGDFWKAHRKVISSVFHFEFLKANVGLIVNTTRELLGEVVQKCPHNINLMGELQNITGEIVGRIFFSENLTQYKLKGLPFTQYLGELASNIGILFKNPLFLILFITGMKAEWAPKYREFLAEINEFRDFCMKIVQDRKNANTGKKDLLGLLLETQKAANVEDRFSDEDIVNEFITFFFAGMDTTGHLMTVLLYLLDKNPEYLQKVEKEVEETYSKADTITTDTLNKMEYSHCVIKETLRMYNPSSTIFPRMAQVDHNIGDIKVKKGTMVKTVPVYNVFHEKHFDEPMKFKPERWIKKKENELDPFVYVPFSAGPRNCIGQHLAVISGKVILAEFVKTFKFKTVPEDYELNMIFTSLYEPKEKIIMHVERK